MWQLLKFWSWSLTCVTSMQMYTINIHYNFKVLVGVVSEFLYTCVNYGKFSSLNRTNKLHTQQKEFVGFTQLSATQFGRKNICNYLCMDNFKTRSFQTENSARVNLVFKLLFNDFSPSLRETVCFVIPRHHRSNNHKTHCFPEGSVNKWFIIISSVKVNKKNS